ncbi:hypothetical protein EPL59_15660 [Salmonella enterica subsp. enterica serovar Strasbourg]|uniref:Uncharacterized protein n=1 Tax=Salmonella enterica subsp. enterica serovar Strasbourg TaxID=682796 RepID=A0A5X7K671_SALET|nr:hypothetical protein [Salmonella enterica]EBR9811197.1 hypothetical protein [Salmonella enterica subsp. enterica serovar Teshie]ECA7542309.1 hypothetical protein [Salmonella enterica subsp. enterica serovar Strasbourg]ECD6621393.1 hypothetical protein [Salmonella enterica subsp. enterica]EBV3613739.1 hypothetical protein [Salmonella enterica subsp. enterica serovar Teshie]
MIHSVHEIQIIHTVRTVQNIHTLSLFSRLDPKITSYGSSIPVIPPGALSPQHMPPSVGPPFCM